MTTPDGVSTKDWDRVHELAIEIVNASGAKNHSLWAALTRRLLGVLDELERKYGPLPSVLATRADYVDASGEREYWLEAAHGQALARGDTRNLVWIATSLASFYLEEMNDASRGRHWLGKAEEYLESSPDEAESGEVGRLREVWRALEEES
jgi:hypothetical protein